MTHVRYEGGLREDRRLAARAWLLTQDLERVQTAIIRPASVALVLTWGLRLKASVLGGAVAVNEISSCCGAQVEEPLLGTHFYCRSCLRVETKPGTRRSPIGLALASHRRCSTRAEMKRMLGPINLEDLAEEYGLDPLSAVVASSSLESLLKDLPLLFGFAPAPNDEE